MTLDRIEALWQRFEALWDRFFFTPESPVVLGLLRICFGLLVLENCLLLAPHLIVFFGDKGMVSAATSLHFFPPPNIDLLALIRPSDSLLIALFVLFVIAAVFLTFGFMTTVSTLIVYLGLLFMHNRNSLIINGGDVLMRLLAFYLLFAPAGNALSVDRLVRLRFRPELEPGVPKPDSRWALRLIQVQVAILYFQAFWSKIGGGSWLNGTAVYYVLHEQEYLRFPVPFISSNLWLCQILSWSTLVIEGAGWTLVWIKRFRYWVLAALVMLHLGIDYTMNLPIFEWVMIVSLIAFVYPEDLMIKTAAIIRAFAGLAGSQQQNNRALLGGCDESLGYIPGIQHARRLRNPPNNSVEFDL